VKSTSLPKVSPETLLGRQDILLAGSSLRLNYYLFFGNLK